MKFKKIAILILIVIAALIGFSILRCKPQLSAQDGEKHLRAFDNELLSLINDVSKSEAMKAIREMLLIDNLPLPFQNLAQSNMGRPGEFNFESNKGIYRYYAENDKLTKVAKSDSIVVVFPHHSGKDSLASFVVAKYAEEPTMWGTMFPTNIDISLNVANHKLLEIKSKGEVNYEIPTVSTTTIRMDKLVLTCDFKSRLNKRKGRFYIDMSIEKGGKQKIYLNAFTKNNITDPKNALLEKLNLSCKVFPLILNVNINYKNVKENTTDYITEFNNNSYIYFENFSNKFVGVVQLKERKNDERLNYAIVYNDTSYTFLDEILLSYDHIMNLRYNDVSLPEKK